MTYVDTLGLRVGTLFILTGAAVSGSLATPAYAAGVTAGSLIENTATATFDQGGSSTTVQSNKVTIKVDELLDVAVSSLDGGNVALSASGAVLRYQIQNTGNGPEAWTITVDPAIGGDDFDPVVSAIAWDSNGNGIYDPTIDTVIAAGGATPSLAPDGMGTAFVVVNWASAPVDGALANVRLTATAVTGTGPVGTVFAGQGENGGDAVVGPQNATGNALGRLAAVSAAVTLVKSAAIADPFGGTEAVPGAVVTYTLRAQVSGTGTVSDLRITDTIPTGTTYRAASLRLDGASLTDATGDDAGSASAAGIAVDLGSVGGGSAREVTFQVAID